ncbi:hypothetical protein ACTFIZ_004663 [Dictyostelium cf. discoideum]
MNNIIQIVLNKTIVLIVDVLLNRKQLNHLNQLILIQRINTKLDQDKLAKPQYENNNLVNSVIKLQKDNETIHKYLKQIKDQIPSILSVYEYISNLSKIYLRYILMAKLRETDAEKYNDLNWRLFECSYTKYCLADSVSWKIFKIDLNRCSILINSETIQVNQRYYKIKEREEELNYMELWRTNATDNEKKS